MALCELFQVEEIRLVEGSFEELTNESLLAQMLRGSPEVRLLIDDQETPLAMARNDNGWKTVSFLWKEPSEELIEILPEMDIKVYTCSTETYREAICDHFSRLMLQDCQPAMDDLPEDRVKKVSNLVWKEWDFKPGELCYDCCCGSGVGSLALSKVGLRAFGYDVDRGLLCRGLKSGRLQTYSTAQLDGTKASRYLERAHFALMLMAGDIDPVNARMWQSIFEEVLLLADRVLVTTASEEEANMMRSWAEAKGHICRVFENPRDPFYDRWVCSI
jgi:hypothetical protein